VVQWCMLMLIDSDASSPVHTASIQDDANSRERNDVDRPSPTANPTQYLMFCPVSYHAVGSSISISQKVGATVNL